MIGFELKQLFFDRQAVVTKIDAATRRVFSRFGAFVRRTAKGSIRKRHNPAPPGSPPSSHTGLLKKFIFFGYDPSARSVVIGPARLNKKGRGDAPSLLEYGGRSVISRRGRTRTAHYQARPFMGPAFEKEKTNLPTLWRGSIR
ncbi:MAG: hypothetical protein IT446_06560 [Phycisphaerales bacterium]|nr:hypothetical protein [Phycisphaerales bacterium]